MDIATLEFATTHPPRWPKSTYPVQRAHAAGAGGAGAAVLAPHRREIADTLYISRRTASTHVSNILGKLGAGNRREAGRIGIKLGLL